MLSYLLLGFAPGLFFGLAKFRAGVRRAGLMAAGLVLAVGLHGLYDLFLLPEYEALGLVSLLGLLPLGLVLLGLKIRWARARSPEYHPELEDRR